MKSTGYSFTGVKLRIQKSYIPTNGNRPAHPDLYYLLLVFA